MTNTQFICDFFFGNIWHFIGLCIVLDIIFSGTIRICNYCSDKKSKKNKNIDELDNE